MEATPEANKAPRKTRAELATEIKRLIVDSVQLHHVSLEEITESTKLFHEGLGLDSVDILEVVVAVERRYGVKVRDAKTGQQIFQSVGTIADFVAQALAQAQ